MSRPLPSLYAPARGTSWVDPADVRLGNAVTAAAIVAGLAWATWAAGVEHRAATQALLVGALASSLALGPVLLRAPRLGDRTASYLFAAYSGSAVLLVAAVLGLQGSASGPITTFLVFPIAFSSLAYPLRLAIGVALATLGGFATTAWVLRTAPIDAATTGFALAGIAVVCLSQARLQALRQERLSRVAAQQTALAALSRSALQEDDLATLGAIAGDLVRTSLAADSAELVEAAAVAQGSTEATALDRGEPVVAVGETGRAVVAVPVEVDDGPAPALLRVQGVRSGEEELDFLRAAAGLIGAAATRRRSRDALAHQALHDPLTGLPNRRLLTDRLEHALAGRDPGHVALLLLDIDDFKSVNDDFGHHVGDQLLQRVAQRVRSVLRPEDTLARFGGDEFVVLCSGLDHPEDAAGVAERLLGAFRDHLRLRADGDRVVEHHLTSSIGVAVTSGGGTTPAELLRDADAAMFRAKRAGRGRYDVFDSTTPSVEAERLGDGTIRRAASSPGPGSASGLGSAAV